MWFLVGPCVFERLLAFQIDDFYRAILSGFLLALTGGIIAVRHPC